MNDRILIVDPVHASRVALRELLEERYSLLCAESAQEGVELCDRRGPFAVAVAVAERTEDEGVELLRRLRLGWPETVRILVGDARDPELLVRALHEGGVQRFVNRSSDASELLEAVAAGLASYQRLESERLLTEQLQFSRESLISITEALERRLAEQVARLQGFHRFAQNLNAARSLEDVAGIAASACSEFLGGRSVRVRLENPMGASSVDASAGTGLVGMTYSQPVISEGEIGRIELERLTAKGEDLTEHDRHLLGSLAASAGAVARTILHRRERDEAQSSTIYALARLAESRDDETGKHLERVSDYCYLIASGLREDGRYVDEITDGFLRDLVISAPLHDIGKVGIPDSILLKPAPLTSAEWEVMRTHTTIGAETLRHVLETSGEQSHIRMGHEIAWAHHERWDGKGYPRALCGEGIPLSARIVALADCYDALTTWRPYKKPWSHEKAVEYVREERGTHFDPAVVDAFLRRSDQADRIRVQKSDGASEPSRPLDDAA